eukprot:TRINITY_DN3776_c0_g1_i1.p1 TRINITY_DN3776_c0_g1~~TRINITY_DN3776_c0_g1_i1.p1  ORF type:complete len:383 (-),score=44.80 TRINITY_DN3776_c0_g1_i1:182-1294(-)
MFPLSSFRCHLARLAHRKSVWTRAQHSGPNPSRPLTSITTIDCGYMGKPSYAAAYLLEEAGRFAFWDNNTNQSIPSLLEELKRQGGRPEDVDYLFVSHIHLDHAGGTGLLARLCPNATVVAHPRAASHLVDPTRIIAGATAVYSPEMFEETYGTILPVAAERIVTMEDEEVMMWGERTLQFLHTRGHANHHFVLHDFATESMFTGDAFGISYGPYFRAKGLLRPILFPSSSPVDFHAGEARISIDKILRSGARYAFPTHFGMVQDVVGGAKQMYAALDQYELMQDTLEDMVLAKVNSQEILRKGEELMKAFLSHVLYEADSAFLPDAEVWSFLQTDIELNAAGLVAAIKKKHKNKHQEHVSRRLELLHDD